MDIESVDIESVITRWQFIVAIVALVFSALSYFKVVEINKRQTSRDDYNYLLSMIVIPYNLLEADLMLLAQGTIDLTFNKDKMDKDTLLALCEAKSYARVHENEALYDFLNRIIVGDESDCDIGKIIDDYFSSRGTITSGNCADIPTEGKKLRDRYKNIIQKNRNNTIDKIKKLTRSF